MSFREERVGERIALTLLTEYFTSRELSFPESMGHYAPKYPQEKDFTPPRGVFLVVEHASEGSEPGDVGCGGIRSLTPTRFEVKHLWISLQARKFGLGRALLVELERRAEEFGATEIVLDTNDSLTAAGQLYASSGYRTIEPYNDNPNATTWYLKKL